MADQHNPDIPAVGNQIAGDIADIEENLEFHKASMVANTTTWSNTTAANNAFNVKPRVAKTAAYTATVADIYIECDTSGGTFAITLPTAATKAGQYYIIKLTTAGNALTITTDGAETIDGADAFGMNISGEVLEIISDGTNWQIIRWDLPLREQRSQFLFKDGDEIYIEPGMYRIPGGQYKYVYWLSQLTFKLQSAGSNADSDDYGVDGWHYIFIDDSAVDTLNTPLLDETCFLNDTTAPTWSDTKQGYYTGADRCIFAAYETGGVILQFYHDGGELVQYGAEQSLYADTYPSTDWSTQVTGRVPTFTTKAQFTFITEPVAEIIAPYDLHWRQGGSFGTGHQVGQGRGHTSDATYYSVTTCSTPVNLDGSDQIDIKVDVATATIDVSVVQNGWYLPTGM